MPLPAPTDDVVAKLLASGSLLLLLTPDELLARLATLVPAPRSHALGYHGLFAPNARHRRRVVPQRPGSVPCGEGEVRFPPVAPARAAEAGQPQAQPPGSFALTPVEPPSDRPLPRTRIPWAELLRRVFVVDVLDCPRCHGRLELVAYIAEAGVARRILDHLGLSSQGPPLARAGPSGPGEDGCEPCPDYGEGDPVYQE